MFRFESKFIDILIPHVLKWGNPIPGKTIFILKQDKKYIKSGMKIFQGIAIWWLVTKLKKNKFCIEIQILSNNYLWNGPRVLHTPAGTYHWQLDWDVWLWSVGCQPVRPQPSCHSTRLVHPRPPYHCPPCSQTLQPQGMYSMYMYLIIHA